MYRMRRRASRVARIPAVVTKSAVFLICFFHFHFLFNSLHTSLLLSSLVRSRTAVSLQHKLDSFLAYPVHLHEHRLSAVNANPQPVSHISINLSYQSSTSPFCGEHIPDMLVW